ncbi:hypothetical protein FA15DRAFT_661463 [Coprinopsis marcescibilis]|uniref:Uncharacterized protein n=1 Tax=Coprinopsis marcescibilis TaxID=230819 RepID=A0A5C3KCN3_COPMA|nr:hypothetical protein FA15DRAFT_661463 [Coprinopsis marcescibilis]
MATINNTTGSGRDGDLPNSRKHASGSQSSEAIHKEMDDLCLQVARMKKGVEKKNAIVRKLKEEIEEYKENLLEKQDKLDKSIEGLDKEKCQCEQYRNWWLNEIQFTKLLFNKVPEPNADWDLVRASQSHYLGRF